MSFVIVDNVLAEYKGNEKAVTVPDGVTEIGRCAFRLNREITAVILPDSVKKINDKAFEQCALLEEISIPESIEEIGEKAFYECTALKNIKLPENVKIGECAFTNCIELADEKGFISIGDTLYGYKGNESEIYVEPHIKRIDSYAFRHTRLKNITLPKGLTHLGTAFYGCDWLEEIDIPDGIKAIADYTFKGCYALKKVRLPDSVETIGSFAFSNCTSIEKIELPEALRELGSCVFNECTALTEINIPDKIEIIEAETFKACSALKSITLPAGIKKIGSLAFAECKALEKVDFPCEKCELHPSAFITTPMFFDENGMKIIAGTLLKYNGKGGKVTIPSTVHTLTTDIFCEDDSRMRKIRHYASCHKGKITEITIPDSVKKIPSGAFYNCRSLIKVNLGNGVEEIGEEAFYGCASLTEINIPASVRFIDTTAFEWCNEFADFHVDESNEFFADIDGMLCNKDKNELIYCPAGKKLTALTVPDGITSIADYAFCHCDLIRDIEIPATVKKIGNNIFYRTRIFSAAKQNIKVAIGAGCDGVGKEVFMFFSPQYPLTHPELPISFPREQETKIRLALGYCLNSQMYSGEYAEMYRKYVLAQKNAILKKAAQLKLGSVEEFINSLSGKKPGEADVYKPDLSVKRPSALRKVELLEEAVIKGSLDDLRAVLEAYKPFEMTARALALAARYRGVDFVRLLSEYSASFSYEVNTTMQKKYTVYQKTVSGLYLTVYSLAVIPDKLNFKESFGCLAYDYTPLCGISYMNITDKLEASRLPLSDRLEAIKFIAENKSLNASTDDMLFRSLITGETEIADTLIAAKSDLSTSPAACYRPSDYDYDENVKIPTYMEVITSSSKSVYRDILTYNLTALKPEKVKPVLERLNNLAKAENKKLVLTQKLYDEIKWSEEALTYALRELDLSKVNKKKAMEAAVSQGCIYALKAIADAGWLSQPSKRDALIEFAQKNRKGEATAWLMDYKSRTADTAGEEAAADSKILRELTENPDSVTAMKRTWSFTKLEDGTLKITSYKGISTEVTVPAKIGKDLVSTISKQAFSPSAGRKPVNHETRTKLERVIIPEGIREIEESAFLGCKALASVSLPDTLKVIGEYTFVSCAALTDINIPAGVENLSEKIFRNCNSLRKHGFTIADNILFNYSGTNEVVKIPHGVTKIVDSAFENSYYKPCEPVKILLPDSVRVIGKGAFRRCCKLHTVHLNNGLEYIGNSAFASTAIRSIIIPETVTELDDDAFYGCSSLRDISLPPCIKSISESSLSCIRSGRTFIHTVEGSQTDKYIKKNYPDATVFYDYGNEDYR